MILLSDVQAADDFTVALDVIFLEVIQKTATLTNQHNQRALGGVVFFKLLKVLGYELNAFGKHSDLSFS